MIVRRVLREAPPVEVGTGELAVAEQRLLRSAAIGSCVVVALYDAAICRGGLVHVMLPGKAPSGLGGERTRYAEDGVQGLVERLTPQGERPAAHLVDCIAGGGNVLQRDDDTICDANVASVVDALGRHGIGIVAEDVGGIQRRSLTLELPAGVFTVTVGDGALTRLWNAGTARLDGGRE